MADLFTHAPGGELLYTFDFTNEVPDGAAITGIDYEVPAPVEKYVDSDDLANKRGVIGLRGVPNGGPYLITAIATINNGEKAPLTLVVIGIA